jgi:predicted secreted protein
LSDKAKRSKVDWEAVEREYRAGQLSVSEVGRQYEVSHTAINKRAKAEGWTRNLAEKVRQVVSERLVSDEVSKANVRETVEAAAARVVDVVRSHRKDISTGRMIVATLFEELLESSVHRDEIDEAIDLETAKDTNGQRAAMMRRAVALPSRAAAMQSLAGALKNIVTLERQAFNIEGGETDEPATKGDVSAALGKLDREARDKLRSVIRGIVAGPEGDVARA